MGDREINPRKLGEEFCAIFLPQSSRCYEEKKQGMQGVQGQQFCGVGFLLSLAELEFQDLLVLKKLLYLN
jgi:hypothetical protein